MKILYRAIYLAFVFLTVFVLIEVSAKNLILGYTGITANFREFIMLWVCATITILCTLLIAIEPFMKKKRVISDPNNIEVVTFVYGMVIAIIVTADLIAFILKIKPSWFDLLSNKLVEKTDGAINILMVEMCMVAILLSFSIWHYRRRIRQSV